MTTNNYNSLIEPFIQVQVSDELFWGFRMNIPKSNLTADQICEMVKASLIEMLRSFNLLNLVSKAQNVRFHIHTYPNIQDVPDNEILYVCGHC